MDVNVHPTKREVHFLNEEAITEHVCDAIHNKLAAIGERTYEYQVTLKLTDMASLRTDPSNTP